MLEASVTLVGGVDEVPVVASEATRMLLPSVIQESVEDVELDRVRLGRDIFDAKLGRVLVMGICL